MAARPALLCLLLVGAATGFGPLTAPRRSRARLRRGRRLCAEEGAFEFLGDEVVVAGWKTHVKRSVRLPTGVVVPFDVTLAKHDAVLVVPFDTSTQCFTLIDEIHPGLGEVRPGVVAGLIEPHKHSGPQDAAAAELEEEARLAGGTFYPLIDGDGAFPASKYADQLFHPFLVVDPAPVEASGALPQDMEESIEARPGISVAELRRLIRSGRLNVLAVSSLLLALDKLAELGALSSVEDGDGG